MYLQTSRLQYNLQGFGVFQTARSDKNIQAIACKLIIPTSCGNASKKLLFRMRITCDGLSIIQNGKRRRERFFDTPASLAFNC